VISDATNIGSDILKPISNVKTNAEIIIFTMLGSNITLPGGSV
jgi:hypothetical protein